MFVVCGERLIGSDEQRTDSESFWYRHLIPSKDREKLRCTFLAVNFPVITLGRYTPNLRICTTLCQTVFGVVRVIEVSWFMTANQLTARNQLDAAKLGSRSPQNLLLFNVIS